MPNYVLPHFGGLDPENLEEYYDVDIDFAEHKIQIHLNFEGERIDTMRLDIVKKFIETLAELDRKNKKLIYEDYADEGLDTIRTYVEHHLEEIGREELSGIVDFDNKSVSPEMQLIKALKLIRLGLYPDSKDQFAILDYSIGQKHN